MVSLRELLENSFTNEVEESIQDAIMLLKIRGINEIPVETFLSQVKKQYSVEIETDTLAGMLANSGMAVVSGDMVKLSPEQDQYEPENATEDEVDKMAFNQGKKDLGDL